MSKLQISTLKTFGGLSSENHLSEALQTRPHLLSGPIREIFSSTYYSNNPMTSLLVSSLSKGTETINKKTWEWKMRNCQIPPATIVEDLNSSSSAGGEGVNFKIKLDKDYYKVTDVLSPGNSGDKILCHIVGNPYPDGVGGFVYELALSTNDKSKVVPAKYLKVGSRWSKAFSLSGEMATEGGSVQHQFPISLQNSLFKTRKELKITDFAGDVLLYNFVDKNGKTLNRWSTAAEMRAMREFEMEKERILWYGTKTDKLQKNGFNFQTGYGLQAQLKEANTANYNILTTKQIQEFCGDLFFGRTDFNKRKIVAFTGELGMQMFDEAIKRETSSYINNIEVAIKSNNSKGISANTYEYGMQFTRYNFINGGSMELILNPVYDDITFHHELDSISGRPLESGRITFFDIGESQDPNIKLIKLQNGTSANYIYGNYHPLSGIKGGAGKGFTSSHSGDYYELHLTDYLGIQIMDITKCGELILRRN